MSDTIRLFVGTSANNEDSEAEAVLEYTARKYCSMPISITWMRQAKKGPFSDWRSSARGRTPFSSYRWALPAVCNFEGRALYTDVDYFFRADLAELWTQPIPGVILLHTTKGKLRTSTMLFDCAKAKGIIPDLPALKAMSDANDQVNMFCRNNREILSVYEGDWNCIDGGSYRSLDDPRLKALHYSRIETQLHLKYAVQRLQAEGRSHWYTGEIRQHARQDLIEMFDRLYVEAQAAGYTVDKYRTDGFAGATRRAFTYKHHQGVPV